MLNVAYTHEKSPRLNMLGQWLRSTPVGTTRTRRPEEDGGGGGDEVIPVLHQFKYRKAVNDLLEGMYPIVDTWRIY